jgi:hypothetical protein
MAVKNIAIQEICSWKSKRTEKFHINLPEVLQVTTDHCNPHLNFSLPKLFSATIQEDSPPPSKLHVKARMSFVSTFIINKSK